MDDEDGGLFNIHISDTEIEADPVKKKAARTDQTEEEFQAVKEQYHAKVENGEIYKSIQLPLLPGVNKQHVQEVLHAAEELYFFRRYEEGIQFLRQVLDGESRAALDTDTISVLEKYLSRCQTRLDKETQVKS